MASNPSPCARPGPGRVQGGLSARGGRRRHALRLVVLLLLIAAPLGFGSIHPQAYVPLLALSSLLGLASWAHGHWARAHGEEIPKLPGRSLLAGVLLVAALQLAPLPRGLLGVLSPGALAHYRKESPLSPGMWHPLSVNPRATQRGIVYLGGMMLLGATVFREFRDRSWSRRLAAAVVATGLVMSVVGLVQAASPEPGRIYGIWTPYPDRHVFGPYVNRSHFGGYMAMAIPLSLAFSVQALQELGRLAARRRPAWTALGAAEGGAFLRRASVTIASMVAVFSTDSRAAYLGCTLGLFTFAALSSRHRARVGLALALLAALAAPFVDWGRLAAIFAGRGFGGERLALWSDLLRMVPDFLWFGVGLNALLYAFLPYQTVETYASVPQAHNEYLQALTDLGLCGAVPVYALLLGLLLRAWRGAAQSPFGAGLCASLVGALATALVDFQWQIPANAATFAALAGLILARSSGDLDPPGPQTYNRA